MLKNSIYKKEFHFSQAFYSIILTILIFIQCLVSSSIQWWNFLRTFWNRQWKRKLFSFKKRSGNFIKFSYSRLLLLKLISGSLTTRSLKGGLLKSTVIAFTSAQRWKGQWYREKRDTWDFNGFLFFGNI